VLLVKALANHVINGSGLENNGSCGCCFPNLPLGCIQFLGNMCWFEVVLQVDMVLLNVVVGIGVSPSSLLSPVNMLTPLPASAAQTTSSAKSTPNYSNVCCQTFAV